jgi:magnesium-protoporphyrin O-methyltransferase
VAEAHLRRLIAAERALDGATPGRTHRVASGFYTSQALELVRR